MPLCKCCLHPCPLIPSYTLNPPTHPPTRRPPAGELLSLVTVPVQLGSSPSRLAPSGDALLCDLAVCIEDVSAHALAAEAAQQPRPPGHSAATMSAVSAVVVLLACPLPPPPQPAWGGGAGRQQQQQQQQQGQSRPVLPPELAAELGAAWGRLRVMLVALSPEARVPVAVLAADGPMPSPGGGGGSPREPGEGGAGPAGGADPARVAEAVAAHLEEAAAQWPAEVQRRVASYFVVPLSSSSASPSSPSAAHHAHHAHQQQQQQQQQAGANGRHHHHHAGASGRHHPHGGGGGGGAGSPAQHAAPALGPDAALAAALRGLAARHPPGAPYPRLRLLGLEGLVRGLLDGVLDDAGEFLGASGGGGGLTAQVGERGGPRGAPGRFVWGGTPIRQGTAHCPALPCPALPCPALPCPACR
jgi:hypothetical protein